MQGADVTTSVCDLGRGSTEPARAGVNCSGRPNVELDGMVAGVRSITGFRAALAALAVSTLGCGSDDATPAPGSAGSGGANSGGAAGSGTSGSGTSGSGGAGGTSAGTSGTGGGGAGGTPTQPACNVNQIFGTPVPIEELNTTHRDASARLTADELTVVFYARLPDDDGLTDSDLYIADRARIGDPFSAPRRLALNVEYIDELRPWISEDGLTLLYDVGEAQETGSSPGRSMNLATRATRQDDFLVGSDLASGESPFVIGGSNGTMYLSDAEEIFRASVSAWAPRGTPLSVHAGPSERPVVTRDELTLYFAAGDFQNIFMAQRASTNEPFVDERTVEELENGYAPSWLSPDGCRLYWDLNTTTDDVDIVMSERLP